MHVTALAVVVPLMGAAALVAVSALVTQAG